jgi:DNA-binding CsgD family transcriptional regulator
MVGNFHHANKYQVKQTKDESLLPRSNQQYQGLSGATNGRSIQELSIVFRRKTMPNQLNVGLSSEVDSLAPLLMSLSSSIYELDSSLPCSLPYLGHLLGQKMQNLTANQVRWYTCQQSLMLPSSLPTLSGRQRFPIQWHQFTYGALYILFPPTTESLITTLSAAYYLAEQCGVLLRMLEDISYVQQQRAKLPLSSQENIAELTCRERETLYWMISGCGNKEIAERMCVSPLTIKKHQEHIYAKLAVTSAQDAILAGLAAGLQCDTDFLRLEA